VIKEQSIDGVHYAFDAVSEKGSYQNISKVLAPKNSKLTLVLPGKDYSEIPDYIEYSMTTVGSVHKDPPRAGEGIKIGDREFGFAFFRFFSRGLQEGFLKPHPHEVVPGGLNGVQTGLQNLKNGVNSASKYVFRIEETK
jgi:NADPH2:quinone reductase